MSNVKFHSFSDLSMYLLLNYWLQSGWESSSVDMNSSPLNPDAPVFVPGSAATDVLLAESPRKPLPMDDIDLPDVTQFRTEAVVRPAELLDLDNCDQLNGHHVSTVFLLL